MSRHQFRPGLTKILAYNLLGLNLRLKRALQVQQLHFVQLLRSSIPPILIACSYRVSQT